LTVSIEREADDCTAAGTCVGPQSDPDRLAIGNSAAPTGWTRRALPTGLEVEGVTWTSRPPNRCRLLASS